MTTQKNQLSKNSKRLSFKGENRSNEDFSGCDIRGADFTNANLVGAKFIQTRAGQTLEWLVCIVIGALFLTFLAGYVSAYSGGIVGSLMVIEDSQPLAFWSSFTALIIFLILILLVFKRGLGTALSTFSLFVAFTVVLIAGLGKASATAAAIVQSVAIAGAISGAMLAGTTKAILKTMFGKNSLPVFIAVFVLGSLFGGWEGIERGTEHLINGLPVTVFIVAILLGLSIYIDVQVTNQNKKYWLICKIVIFLTSLGGTKFRGANLTNADFTLANLGSSDFRMSILDRTCWFKAANIECSRLEGTYLENEIIRKLVITKEGEGQHFENFNLQRLNLKEANLKDSFLIEANLSESNLENVNFTGAKLAKAQFYKSNLSGVCLTGAYIENWGISTDTKLDNIRCDYIYMHLPTVDDPDPCRKPDNKKENFKEGDFSDFIAPIIKTLDFYQTQNLDLRRVASNFKTIDLFHYDGIDPSAAAIALKQLIELHPEAELEIIALEGRGNEKIRLQAKVTGDTNRSALNAEYFAKYQQIKSLPYSDMQSLLTGIEEKDERIRGLEKLLENAISQPKFYVETYQNQGEFIMTQQNKGNVNISGVQGNISGIAAAGENQTMTGVALGAISGNVTNTISQLPDSTDPNEPSLKELLSQLQALIESESELNEEDKVEALEQVKVLAESGQKPEDSTLQKLAKTAVKILKGTISSLPDVTKLVESGAKLLPYITKLLGLP